MTGETGRQSQWSGELASGSEAGRRRARLRRRGVAGWWRRKAPLPLPPWAGRTGEALWAGSEAHRGGLTHSAGVPWGRASEGFGNGNLRPPGLLQMQIDCKLSPGVSRPPLIRGTWSQTPSGCPKPRVVPNLVCTLFPLHVHPYDKVQFIN